MSDDVIKLEITTTDTLNYTTYSRYATRYSPDDLPCYKVDEVKINGIGSSTVPAELTDMVISVRSNSLNTTNNIDNLSSKFIFTSTCNGHIFQIKPLAYQDTPLDQEETVRITGSYYLTNSGRNNYNKHSSDTNVSKPLIINAEFKIEELIDTVKVIPELNTAISCDLSILKNYLRSVNITDKYRTDTKQIEIYPTDDKLKEQTNSYIINNVSLGLNIIINDPNYKLSINLYYTYLLNNIVPIFVNRNHSIKEGVYFVISEDGTTIKVSNMTLELFKSKVNFHYQKMEFGKFKFTLGKSKTSIAQYLKDHSVSTDNDTTMAELGYQDEIRTLKDKIVHLETARTKNIDKIGLLEDRLSVLYKLKISQDTVDRSTVMKEKAEIDYNKVRYVYPSEVASSNFKNYVVVATAAIGLISTALVFLKK